MRVLGAIRAITGLNRRFNRPGRSLGDPPSPLSQPQSEAGQGQGSPWTGSRGAGTPGTSAPRSPAAATSGASSCRRAQRCCRRGCRSGRTSGGRPRTAAAAAAAPYPYQDTGVSGPGGAGVPRRAPKAIGQTCPKASRPPALCLQQCAQKSHRPSPRMGGPRIPTGMGRMPTPPS